MVKKAQRLRLRVLLESTRDDGTKEFVISTGLGYAVNVIAVSEATAKELVRVSAQKALKPRKQKRK